MIATASYLSARSVPSGKILPGFRMPCGSNAAFTRFISAISSADNSSDRYGALVKPMPCSPLIDPFQRNHALEQRALRLARPCQRLVVRHHDVDVNVAVAGMAEARNWEPAPPANLRDQLEQLRHAASRHHDVVVELDRGNALQRRRTARAAGATAPDAHLHWRRAELRWRPRQRMLARPAQSLHPPRLAPSTSRISAAPAPSGARDVPRCARSASSES